MTFTLSNRRPRDESNVRTDLVLQWVSDNRMGPPITHHSATNHRQGRTRQDVNRTQSAQTVAMTLISQMKYVQPKDKFAESAINLIIFNVCRSKSVHEVKSDQFQSKDSELDSDFYVDMVNTSFSHYDQAFATVNIGPKKTPIKFKIDTGSQVNIVPLSTFRDLNIKHPLLPPETQLSSYMGNPLNFRGTIYLNYRYKAKQIETLFYVVETSRSPLMSLKTSLDLSLIQLIYSVDNPGGQNEICTKEQIMREYPDLFKGVDLIPGDVELHLKPDEVPVINAPM